MNVNPIVSEIVSGALRSLEEEVEDLLARIWRSPALRDSKDFSVSLYDRFGRALTGRTLGAGPGPILSKFAAEDLRPADVFLHNDPYLPPAGLGEMAEICLTRPLFGEGELIAFLQVRGRHDDLGGFLPGGGAAGASESFHEGLIIPPVRIANGGERVEDIQTMLLRNSRFPEMLKDDIDAQIGALQVGALRLRELVDRYDAEQLTACFADLLRESEMAFKDELLPKIPEKSQKVKTQIETDGYDGPHVLSVTLFREGEKLVVELGAGPQARGPINCPLEGEGKTSLSRLISPLLLHLADNPERMAGILLNDGACRAIDIRLPEPGTLLTPKFPAPTGLRSLTMGRLFSAFGEALFLSTGGVIPAGFDNLRFLSLWGSNGDEGSFLFREALGAGSGGAPQLDGLSAVPPIGGHGGMPAEVVEARYPIRIESAGLVPSSGGAGEFRGGPGTYREYRFMAGGHFSSAAESEQTGPFGGKGGEAGSTYRITLAGKSGKSRRLSAITADESFEAGDMLRVETPGGGGWGKPQNRAPEAVRLDVLRGMLSKDSAKTVYGVALGRAPGYALNSEETAKLRGKNQKKS
ncbi:MAG: hydantoinase B/oxoprolinase family protein [Nitrospinaceae bacterium]|jgi:N-methylhydantoinase B|nr:hydantoinase B/oxoprolinase family protein [Nitrospinaceae bacterium]MBT3434037.1 hydantoinase B/oxoprolinase family protein [Nitrospinaceae bacterium]MBT3819973.1 hydantoinase B/oxoprolinase family protein [Nitrospinaceae bacterium]MBT4429157.1 hydantoinase B/oxoprolinase family protein [Nitrospinaceae bacterium]MBT5369169.1 hydantoinase B/oxoprolinase family protein [Nitrospinaceae bacterium]